MLFSRLHNGTKLSFFSPAVILLDSLLLLLMLPVVLPWHESSTALRVLRRQWNWTFDTLNAAFHSIPCLLLLFFPPLFSTAASFHRRKLNPLGGKISPCRKRLQLCSQVQETEGMWGSLAVKWLSVLRCCTARWHNTVRSVYVKLQVLKVSQSLT